MFYLGFNDKIRALHAYATPSDHHGHHVTAASRRRYEGRDFSLLLKYTNPRDPKERFPNILP